MSSRRSGVTRLASYSASECGSCIPFGTGLFVHVFSVAIVHNLVYYVQSCSMTTSAALPGVPPSPEGGIIKGYLGIKNGSQYCSQFFCLCSLLTLSYVSV